MKLTEGICEAWTPAHEECAFMGLLRGTNGQRGQAETACHDAWFLAPALIVSQLEPGTGSGSHMIMMQLRTGERAVAVA